MEIRVFNLRDWMKNAECRGSDFDFVPPTESAEGLSVATSMWCNVCPVRDECLVTALKNGWKGYWGGTLTSDRNKLRSMKRRKKCPLCKSVNLITADRCQICVACGRSWTVGNAPSDGPQEVTTVGDFL